MEPAMIHTDRIDYITAHGTGRLPRKIRLADDAVMSVQAGPGAHCHPRPKLYGTGSAPADFAGPYTHVEVYLFEPLTAPAEWAEHKDFGVYSAVPVALVRALVVAHGGEHVAQDDWDDVVKGLGESYLNAR
jgi:hypothetical protein